ncbi:hypothetical protein M409DRAFT_71371 [Zasmidium cellare ATCC 36951]|uniref:Uncharacterized protein n=1 Tax=Zasmidium cellare ATCC 36951 TaxID=1080233 RepID=A0A6A6BY16_ZASCE|nr:uncharacterized protein M409DRAFT_71371 [Zasmidium cellare ATCC 36951]KAF2158958.1 hypothetical protein M409DRAFT_71371 [Zasmidium cellare ATCC 36951]
MERGRRVASMLTGDRNEDSAYLHDLLSQIHDLQNEQKQLFQTVRFRVRKVNQNDVARSQKFEGFPGTDDNTLSLLRDFAAHWWESPLSAWEPCPPAVSATLAVPEAYIMDLYSCALRDDA